MKKHLKMILILGLANFQIAMANRLGASLFILGKALRFIFFFAMLIILTRGTRLLGYTVAQVAFFYLTFNLIDITAQFLFRSVYTFRPRIVTGTFDLVLVKPVNALAASLLSTPDILDLVTLPPLVGLLIYFASRLGPLEPQAILVFLILVLNGLLLATAFHIAVLSLGVLTTAIDHTIMIYRDLTAMARIPVDFYREPLRGLLTFVIPVGIMMTFPAKALMGLLQPEVVIYSLVFGVALLWASIQFWHWSLTHYSSASS